MHPLKEQLFKINRVLPAFTSLAVDKNGDVFAYNDEPVPDERHMIHSNISNGPLVKNHAYVGTYKIQDGEIWQELCFTLAPDEIEVNKKASAA